ncbi:hypothetical protein L6R29_23810 [Myxococcota bacterium]|nr:hypothetical protein [Myxococcota bacterium]
MPHPHCSVARFIGILGALSVGFALGCQAPTTHPIPPSRPATAKPAASTTQSAASTTQSAASTTQPAASTTQPAASTTQPAASTTQSAASTTQPAASTTQPAASKQAQVDVPMPSPAPERPAKSPKQRCQQVVQKYTRCMQAAYQLALSQQSRLPPNEAARSKPLLAQLRVALHDPKREARLLSVCFRTPPNAKWLRCILQSPCDQLNRCRKTHIPQNY